MVWQQEHRLSYEDFLERHRVVVYFFIALFLLLGARLFHLQIILGRHFFNLSEKQRTHIVLERAPRGVIYDCNGNVIVGNKTTFVALFYPFSQDVMPTPAMLDRLQKILGMRDLATRMSQGLKTGKAVRLSEDLSKPEMMRLQEQRLMFPGISVVKEARRDYRSPETNSHLVGYINEITKPELDAAGEENYKMGDWVGRSGLERVYDTYIRGQDGGWEIEVDASGHQTQLVRYIEPDKGNSVYTSIDAKLQEVAAAELKKTPTGRGAVVGIDPRTGAVKILVSSPGFDPNYAMQPEFGKYLVNKNLPLYNRAVQALYPPGSIFKIITFTAAVNEGRIDPLQSFFCSGSFAFGNKIFKCWNKKGHGRMTLIPALANSCDVYFYQLGLKVGPEFIEQYAKMFRLGEITGIDLPSEKKGLVPSAEWKLKKMADTWHPGDTINIAIGQGPLWVSPMQMAQMIATVANKGTLYKPYIVQKIMDEDDTVVFSAGPKKIGSVELSKNTWDLLYTGLITTVKEGTGHACIFNNLNVAAKTGTAQNPHGQDHAWFVAFAPVEDPQLAIAIVVENGGSGSAIAGPVAREIFSAAFKLNENKKLELNNAEEIRN